MYIPTKFICYSVLWLVLLYCQNVALFSVESSVIMGDEFETFLKEKIMDQVRYIPDICLENLVKATTKFGQHDRCTCLLNKSIVGPSTPPCSVTPSVIESSSEVSDDQASVIMAVLSQRPYLQASSLCNFVYDRF
jgi:hypothetical protein